MSKVILSFDPGLSNLGYGCLQKIGKEIEYVDSGIHKQKSKTDIGEKLLKVNDFIRSLIQSFNPDIIAFEKMFFRGRSDSAASTIKVIGLIQISATCNNIPTLEVSPPTLKKFITGNGRADKKDMKEHTLDRLFKHDIIIPDKITHHEIDALAIGLYAYDYYE